jgi:hypothetical protein
MESLWKGFNDRLIVMQLPLPAGKQASLISTYTPTMTNPGEVKNKFYKDFSSLLSRIHKEDKLLLFLGISMPKSDVTIGLGRAHWANKA